VTLSVRLKTGNMEQKPTQAVAAEAVALLDPNQFEQRVLKAYASQPGITHLKGAYDYVESIFESYFEKRKYADYGSFLSARNGRLRRKRNKARAERKSLKPTS
jgi:cytochrome oxidase Cu insertion factor (SCO1/SenC/PrrC family)